jgi:RNase P protein component
MVLSVPKRLLKQSVRRNQAKRVARESWREFVRTDTVLGLSSLGPQFFWRYNLRLSKAPATVLVAHNPNREVGASAVKQQLRSDCDRLWQQWGRYLQNRKSNSTIEPSLTTFKSIG